MSQETKICKHCKEEINKKAKKCPKCGGKLGIPGFVRFLIAAFIVIAIIMILVVSCVKGLGDAIDETENSYLDVNGKTSFNIDEAFENSYIKMTMSEVDLNFEDYSEYLGPKDGYKVVMAKFEVENIGEDDQYVSSIDFSCYADGVAMEEFYYANDNYETLSSTISSEKTTIGYVFYEVPEDSENITLEYDASWTDSNNITFVLE